MGAILDKILVAILILGAASYLVYAFSRKKNGGACPGCTAHKKNSDRIRIRLPK